MNERLIIKVTRENLPQVKDRYPFLYLERGRLEIDDSSVKWINSDGDVIRIPCATINAILLGPGTSVTHEAVKVMAASNCMVAWVGEDSLLFYALGQTPTANSRNLREQMELASYPKSRLEVAKRLFSLRFPNIDIHKRTLNELKGMEGIRVRNLYQQKSEEYNVPWSGRRYKPGDFEKSDVTNKILTASNAALYGILTAAICSMGFSPRIGFIHSGSPLPFVYDMSDLYKDYLCIDLAFCMTDALAANYDRYAVLAEFRKRAQEIDLLKVVGDDIIKILRG